MEYQEFVRNLSDYAESKNIPPLKQFKLDSISHQPIFQLYGCTFVTNGAYIEKILGMQLKIQV